ncbi:hypothetical protein D0A37_03040 [Microcoleus vaginatus HSN003]|nr:hypothetical protein D0A37_03040 [Microcoleus vaginatus HSN003]
MYHTLTQISQFSGVQSIKEVKEAALLVAIGFTINVRSKPAIEIAPTLASPGPPQTGKLEPASD